MASARATDEELDKQATEMAAKALPASLPEAVRRAKLPAVKEKILARLKAQRGEAAKQPIVIASTPAAASAPPQPQAGMPGMMGMPCGGQPAPPQGMPPPPPPPSEEKPSVERIDGIELCGDEPWFSETATRRRLRESVAEAHKEQKILVGNPADEIPRICPEDGRVLGAGAVLRLGGAHLGGYGESDVAYAYRQLSRALHPDKNPDLARAPDAFHRLSEAADELRQGLQEQRAALQQLVGAMGGQATSQMLERPQEALFAEATRMLLAVCGLTGEGAVPTQVQHRAVAAFSRSGMYHSGNATMLLTEWFDKNYLLDLYASVPVRTAYDCAPKRMRAHFLCLLNRAAVAEAKRFNDCVRGSWPMIMQTFPELGLWRDLRESIRRRVWDSAGEPLPPPMPEEPEPKKKASRSRSRSRRDRRKSRSRSGSQGRKRNRWGDRGDEGDDRGRKESRYAQQDRQRDLAWDARWSTSDDPGYDPNAVKKEPVKDKKQRGRDRRMAIETHLVEGWRACRWARKWRGAMAATLPAGVDSAASFTDPQMRKMGAALWKDLTKHFRGTEIDRVLGLFRADTQTPKTFGWDSKGEKVETSAPRGLAADTPPAEWSFVPVTDLMLVVGEGIVGVTNEGAFACNPSGHKRKTFGQCFKDGSEAPKKPVAAAVKTGSAKVDGHDDGRAAEAKNNGREQSKGSKWDVQ